MEITGCRVCGNYNLKLVLDYGEMPLVNTLVAKDEPQKTYPLKLVECSDCGLLQITETVPPEELFSEYPYFSSQSETMLKHSKQLVGELIDSRKLTADSLVVELASNDGYLLQYYAERGIPVLGIEPAANVAKVAVERGIPTRTVFFNADEAEKLVAEGFRADVIHAHNVLPHVADLHGFVEGIRLLLKPDGVAVIEVVHVKETIENCEFDTVYHEHLCYFAIRPLVRLLQPHGLEIVRVSPQKIHGGSLRLYVTHDELDLAWFAIHAKWLQAELALCLDDIKVEGKSIAAYGAAAKGCILLNACGIGDKTIDYCVDSTPAKQGKFIPGTGIRIYPPEKLMSDQPDYCLILAWNFAEEIMAKSKGYRGKFIIPIPSLRICT